MKALLIAVASLLVIGGVAMVLMMSKTDDPKPKREITPATNSGAQMTPTAPSTDPQPALPTPPPSLGSGGSDNPKEYMVGDVKVRDHRSGSNGPRDIPPNPHPANDRDIPSELTHSISQQVKNAIYACSTAVPKEAKGEKPKVIGQLKIAIKDHKLTITGLALETRDISDPAAADALKQCSQEKSAGFTSPAKDQDDIADYNIQLDFALP